MGHDVDKLQIKLVLDALHLPEPKKAKDKAKTKTKARSMSNSHVHAAGAASAEQKVAGPTVTISEGELNMLKAAKHELQMLKAAMTAPAGAPVTYTYQYTI